MIKLHNALPEVNSCLIEDAGSSKAKCNKINQI